MALNYIDNVTILAEVGESVTLPSVLIARMDNGDMVPVHPTWTPNTVDVSEEGEFIFVGRVSGYVHNILCSVQVGYDMDNPESEFPESIDEFGIPKKDIHTADIPDIDDYQYYKAKVPRTLVEEYQLKQLRESLADKIILARDVNHMRNAIIAIEKNFLTLRDRIEELERRMDALEARVDNIEQIMVTDGENVGRGEKVFKEKRNKKLQFRTLIGKGDATVFKDGDEIVIDVDAPVGCGKDVKGNTFKTCGTGENFPITVSNGIVAFSNYFNFQMVKIKEGAKASPNGYHNSLLGVFGVGDSVDKQDNSGRFLKGVDGFVFEFRVSGSRYVGFEFGNFEEGFRPYDESSSKIDDYLYNKSAYSSAVSLPEYMESNARGDN